MERRHQPNERGRTRSVRPSCKSCLTGREGEITMFRTQSCESLKQDNEYLRDERDRLEREHREAEDRRWQEEKERKARRQKEYEESLCWAEGWTDAFIKGLARVYKEAALESQFNTEVQSEYSPDTFFNDQIPVIEKAQHLYHQKMAVAKAEWDAIEQRVREEVADELEA